MEIIKKRMKDKTLYQRRTDGDYKGYTEDSFYFNSTEQLRCWKQTSTGKIFKAKTINELKKNRTPNKKHTRKIYTKEIDCFNYSNRLYKRCRFYWHKKTSKHNRRLCNVAQLLKNDKKKKKEEGKGFSGGV